MEFQKNIYFYFTDYAKGFDCVGHNKLWKILKEMRVPDHLACLLRNLYAGQEATVRTGHGTKDWFKTGKGVWEGHILSLCLFNSYAEYITRNDRLKESQAKFKTVTSWNQDSQDTYQQPQICRWYHSNVRKWRGTKEPIVEGEKGVKKAALKLNIQKTKTMSHASNLGW